MPTLILKNVEKKIKRRKVIHSTSYAWRKTALLLKKSKSENNIGWMNETFKVKCNKKKINK